MKNNNFLNDSDFLKKLDECRNKTVYAKIISLTIEEFPREEIVGQVTAGTINIDGTSSVRRTCSLSMVANDINLNSFYWGLSSKFKLFIGLENKINSFYPEIIWFPQGTYVITNFSSSQNINSYSISIQGKDKMCLLNGDLGGSLTAVSTVFDSDYTELADKSQIANKIPIKNIIYRLVNQIGGESLSNIIIDNLDDYGLELLNYNANVPLYMIFDENGDLYQTYMEGNTKVVLNGTLIQLSELAEDNFIFKSLSPISININPTEVQLSLTSNKKYTIAKLFKGEAAGYRLTDITYAGDLVGAAGETLTSILDKIKKQLGDFEYFYDVEGRFVFQRKKTYINVGWTPIQGASIDQPNTLSTQDAYIEASIYASPLSYNFEGNELISGMSNSPNLLNIKNDYSIWGTRKSQSTGSEIPIHLRYAIDKKPVKYVPYASDIPFFSADTDWREILYQMAMDWMNYHERDDFIPTLCRKNPEFLQGKTGYESYYIDMQGFWRQLYNKNPSPEEVDNFYPRNHEKEFWNKNIFEDPSQLNFWIDFLDTEGELGKYSVQSIGRRQKVVNDSNVKSIYFKQVPLAIFYDAETDKGKKDGYSYFKLGQGTTNFFDVSSQGKSAQDELNSLLYQHTNAQETISLSCVPIYYLQPNTLIYVKDDKNLDINGKYSISKLTIPLAHNGLMTVTATKIINRIQ